MSTTRSFFGKSKGDAEQGNEKAPASVSSSADRATAPSVAPGTLIDVARFVGQFMIGRELEPMTSISNGARFRDRTVEVSYFNDVFMAIDFSANARDNGYQQLVPWAAVSTIIIK